MSEPLTPQTPPTERREAETNAIHFPHGEEFAKTLEAQGFSPHAETLRKVLAVAEEIIQVGGRALLVGGAVRDLSFGKIAKDFDLEVYGIQPHDLEQLVKAHGKIHDVGRAFGILKLKVEHGLEIDLSLPRTDSKIAAGHRGFEVSADPFMSIEEAARRRDFTMNSLAMDPLTGEVFDYFGGLKDIAERRLRITDPERFRDDPLRVLRGMQFIGRFGLQPDAETVSIILSMLPELRTLPKERVFEEWRKLLLKSEKPSLGMAAGMAWGVFRELHPEFVPLKETMQEAEWHPERDVWTHTMMAADQAAHIIRREQLVDDEAMVVMLGSLSHDLGKPATTTLSEEGRIISHQHDQAGAEPTKKFLAQLGVSNLTRDKVVKIVLDHLTPGMLFLLHKKGKPPVKDGTIRRLAERIAPATIRELVMVAEADHTGRGPFTDPKIPEQLLIPSPFDAGPWLLARARACEAELSKPPALIRGRDLINVGLKQDLRFNLIIGVANDLRDDHLWTRDQVLREIDGCASAEQALQKLQAIKTLEDAGK